MKIGLQTISWGESLPLGIDFFRCLSTAGFSGLEIFQSCSLLGPPRDFNNLMLESGLTILGLSGGKLSNRLEFAEKLDREVRPKYFYVTDLFEDIASIKLAIEKQYTIAIHPFLYTPINTLKRAHDQRLEFISQHNTPQDRITILPDTAHSYLAQDDLLEWLNAVESGVVKAIHLKDWQPSHGSSITTFSRGFCGLGQGVMKESLSKLISDTSLLSAKGVEWLVIEQDYSATPLETALDSINFLQVSNVGKSNAGTVPMAHAALQQQNIRKFNSSASQFAAGVMSACMLGIDRLYEKICHEWMSRVGASVAIIWEVQSNTAIMRRFETRALSEETDQWKPTVTVLNLRNALCRESLADQQPVTFDVTKPNTEGKEFLDKPLLIRFGVTHMLSAPIFNQWNAAQPELLINLFGDDTILDPKSLDSLSHYGLDRNSLGDYRYFTSVAVQHCWDDHREQIENRVIWQSCKSKSSRELLDLVSAVVKEEIRAQHIYIFVVKQSGDGNVTLVQKVPRPLHSESVSNLAYGTTAKLGAIALKAADAAYRERQVINNAGALSGTDLAVLAVPWSTGPMNVGSPAGIICCIGKKAKKSDRVPASRTFATTDEIIVDAAQAALMPHYSQFAASEDRAIKVGEIAHQLKHPINLIMNCADAMIDFEQDHKIIPDKEYNAQKILRYSRHMIFVVNRAAALNPNRLDIVLKRRILIFEDIVIPALDELQGFLRRLKLSHNSIDASRVSRMPPMYVDPMRFQEVVYNILSNAIKYRQPDKAFRVAVYPEPVPGGTMLVFEDDGIGIPVGMENKIFEENTRAVNAQRLQIEGDGLGLCIARQLLSIQGADIRLIKHSNPTKFGVFMPFSLESP
jgi:signal transduction histidine kinase/sugar phosphate isomerase/epimerase